MNLAPGAIVGAKYRIERALARGGMGSLWVARHAQLGSSVAIKFLDASFAASPAHRARFEREARAAANLKSPHVVQVFDYGFEGAAPYIVMELLEGEDLGQRLHRVRRMGLKDSLKVLVQVGKALRKAHEAGFAHRDLKPANLFIAKIDDEEVVKILDFGIAKEQHAALGDATRTGEVIGSPHYMSPEQVRAEKDLDHRTDLWSMGIILYRMLTGVLPFPGDQLGPVLAKILTDPLQPPSAMAPDLPPGMDAFFTRALARDKNQRFQSIGEMVEAFQAAAGGREAFPSISMSLGTGQIPAASGTAVLTGSALQTASGTVTGGGPITGSGQMAGSGPVPGPMAGSGPVTGGGPFGGSGPITGSGPMAGSGPIGGSGPVAPGGLHGGSGPITGSAVPTGAGLPTGSVTTGGLASTGAPPRSKGVGLAIGVGIGLLAAAAVGFLAFRSPSSDAGTAEPAGASSGAPAAAASSPAPSAEPAATADPAPTATASAAATSEPAPTATASATAAASAPSKAPVVKPKITTKPKEKWF